MFYVVELLKARAGPSLLNNLFRLDGTPAVVRVNDPKPSMSPDDLVSNIVFEPGLWTPPNRKIRGVTFRDVAFSKTTMKQLTFTDCRFEDCLFLGTHMSEVEFHGCDFVNCNFWKVRLEKVYLRPDKIVLEERFQVEAANVGISIFQAMLSNFAEERQDHFYMLADIRFRRWKRYQIAHELRRKNITPSEAKWQRFSSIVYEALAGFGYRPLRFFLWTIALFFAISGLNYYVIGDAIQVGNAPADHASFVDAIYYSFSVLTVLGFSSVLPVTGLAKILTVFEALASIGWLGIFTSVLVKRFLR